MRQFGYKLKEVDPSEIEGRFQAIDRMISPENRVLVVPLMGSDRISNEPLSSEPYENCVGIVLLKKGYALLTHHNSGGINERDMLFPMDLYDTPNLASQLPEQYLSKGLQGLIESTGDGDLSDITAFGISGRSKHLQEARDFLQSKGITLVSWYDDNSEDMDHERRTKKKLIVEPTTEEVLLFSRETGYHQLH